MNDELVIPADSIHGVLMKQAEAIGRRPAVEFGDRILSYRDTARMAKKFASSLSKLGIGKGDKVGIMFPNVPEFLFAYYGALMTGATVVLVNVMLKPGEIEYLASHSEMKAMIYLAAFHPQVEEGTRGVESLRHRIASGGEIEGAARFEELLESGDENFEPAKVELGDLAHLIYTSGTTGKPKGAMITHGNVMYNLASMDKMRPRIEAAKVLCVLPLFHAYGLISVMNGTMMRGGSVFLLPKFDAAAVIDALKNRAITTFAGTPTMYFHILNHPDSKDAVFPSLLRAGSGGAALPVEVRTQFRERFQVDITEGYGMSETTVSAIGYTEGMPIKSGSVGVGIPGVDVRVVNDQGEDCLIGDVGEIIIRGPNIMQGYYKNPEATAEALRDGWLYTGDLAWMDEKGYITIVDRKKDMIIKGGYNIYPREIEEVIYELPQVNMAAVVGRPDLAKGETVHAFVSLKLGQSLTEEEVMARLKDKLAKYKLPESVKIVPEIPVGPTGKILKREIKSRWEEFGK